MTVAYKSLLLTCLLGSLLITGCASESFAVRPGFKNYFEQYPPDPQIPDESGIALLKKHKPRIYKSADQQGPIDFYRQYIANGTLDVKGARVSTTVTAQELNKHRDDPTALFEYTGQAKVVVPATVYARVDRDTLSFQGKTYDLQFLSYNLVFPTSGMIHGLSPLSSTGLAIAGNLSDWHQLDHYVGLSLVLFEDTPVAIMLQQHNYQSTYIIDADAQLLQDGRVAVDIAQRSNELYLHREGETRHPAVSFVSAENIEFILTGQNKPMMAGYDVTNGTTEVDYTLQILPQTDAFYQFKGQLGKSRLLPGRDGPPGADFVTLPGLMPRAIRLVSGYRTDSLATEKEKISALINKKSFTVNKEAIDAYKRDFLSAANLSNR